MKHVPIEMIRERMAELNMDLSLWEISPRGEFELACLRQLLLYRTHKMKPGCRPMSNIDKQALVIPQREKHDWSQAVMRDCDFCQQWALTVKHSDGGCICASCCDSEYTTALSSALVVAIERSEAAEKRIAEHDRKCDEQYLLGMRAGWNFGLLEDADGFDATYASRRNLIEAERAGTAKGE